MAWYYSLVDIIGVLRKFAGVVGVCGREYRHRESSSRDQIFHVLETSSGQPFLCKPFAYAAQFACPLESRPRNQQRPTVPHTCRARSASDSSLKISLGLAEQRFDRPAKALGLSRTTRKLCCM
jgi:hypothetical protein